MKIPSEIGMYSMIVLFAIGFDGLFLLRLRRIWVPLAASIACVLLFHLMVWTDAEGWLANICYGTLLLGCLVGWGIGGWRVMQAVRTRTIAAYVAAAFEWGAPTVTLRNGKHHTLLEELEVLLPLVEPIGHVPGFEEITPAWIRAQIAIAREHEPEARKLLLEAPEKLPIKKRWWLPSDL